MLKVLIDGDILVYRAGFSSEKKTPEGLHIEPVANAYSNIKRMIRNILFECNSTDYGIYLTASNDETNFRKVLYPAYKENRKKYKRPEHYDAIRSYLSDHYNCITVSGIEADDALSIDQYQNLLYDSKGQLLNSSTIIASIDKDLDIVPGNHYNFVKDKHYFMSQIEGLRLFYKQILTGDRVDNIPPIKKGWRKKEAFKKLDNALTEWEMYTIIHEEIDKNLETLTIPIMNTIEEMIEFRGKLLWPLRSLHDEWNLPV